MKFFSRNLFVAALFLFALQTIGAAEFKTPGDKMFAAYFKAETDRLAARCLADRSAAPPALAGDNIYRAEIGSCT